MDAVLLVYCVIFLIFAAFIARLYFMFRTPSMPDLPPHHVPWDMVKYNFDIDWYHDGGPTLGSGLRTFRREYNGTDVDLQEVENLIKKLDEALYDFRKTQRTLLPSLLQEESAFDGKGKSATGEGDG